MRRKEADQHSETERQLSTAMKPKSESRAGAFKSRMKKKSAKSRQKGTANWYSSSTVAPGLLTEEPRGEEFLSGKCFSREKKRETASGGGGEGWAGSISEKGVGLVENIEAPVRTKALPRSAGGSLGTHTLQ